MTFKRIIIIAIAVLLIIFVGLLVYNLFFKERGREGTTSSVFRSPEALLGGSSESQPAERLIKVTDEPIAGFRVNRDRIITISTGGVVGEYSLDGEAVNEVANLSTNGVIMGEVSPDGSDVALKIIEPESGQSRWLLFDGTKLINFPANTKSVSLSVAGKVLSLRERNNETDIVIITDTKEEIIFTTSIPDLTANWLDEKTVVLETKPSGLAAGILYFLDTERSRLSRLVGGRHGLTTLVSPKKDKVIFSETATSGRQLKIKVLDRTKNAETTLALNTLPERCVFSQDNRTLYCATFEASPDTLVMPDEYHKGAFGSESSTIFKINLETGSTNVVAQDLAVQVTEPQLSSDESALFFINKKDGSLYRLKLN